MERMKASLREEWDFKTFLEAFIEEIYNITDEHKEVIVLCYSGMAIDYSMELWESIYQPYYEWFERELQRGIDNGELIPGINVKWTSKLLINMIENAAERFYIGRDQDMTKEESMREVYRFVARSIMKHQDQD